MTKIKTLMPTLTRSQVDHMLLVTPRAEQPGIPQPYLDAGVQTGDYPNLEKNDTEDGVWACCACMRETSLIHVKGPHPFKHLDCVTCGHVLCTNCVTSDIIIPWDQQRVDRPLNRPGGELRLFQVCPGCGLSHRAVMAANRLEKCPRWPPLASHFDACLCAEPAASTWPKYVIGQPYTFRMNAERAKNACQEKLARNKVDLLFECLPEKQSELPRERADSMYSAPSMLPTQISRKGCHDMSANVGPDVFSHQHRDARLTQKENDETMNYGQHDADLNSLVRRILCASDCVADRVRRLSEPVDVFPGQDLPCSLMSSDDGRDTARQADINVQTKVSLTVPKMEEWEELYLLADKKSKLTEKVESTKEWKIHDMTEQMGNDPFELLKWLEKNRDPST